MQCGHGGCDCYSDEAARVLLPLQRGSEDCVRSRKCIRKLPEIAIYLTVDEAMHLIAQLHMLRRDVNVVHGNDGARASRQAGKIACWFVKN